MELESRHGIPDKQRDELISRFYFNKFPRPGESIKIDLTNITSSFSVTSDAKKSSLNCLKGFKDKTEDVNDGLDLTSYIIVEKCGEYGTLNKVITRHMNRCENLYVNVGDVKQSCSSPRLIAESNGSTELIITLHSDSRYEAADLKPLHELSPDILQKIFASLLLERKVILVSCAMW